MGGYKYATLLPVTKNELSNDVVKFLYQGMLFLVYKENYSYVKRCFWYLFRLLKYSFYPFCNLFPSQPLYGPNQPSPTCLVRVSR